MKIFILISSMLLCSCAYQVTSSTDIKKAEAYCADKLGVHEIVVNFLGREDVFCENGDTTEISVVKLTTSVGG